MFINILHELEVLEAFFARQASAVVADFANISTDAALLESEDIEARLFHPQGPCSVEQIICRMTVNELNSLVETAMQDALVRVSGDSFFTSQTKSGTQVKLVYSLKRSELEQRLIESGISVKSSANYLAVQQVKEISEGNKHREGLRPVPKWDGTRKTLAISASLVPGSTDTWYSSYEFELSQVQKYMFECRNFIYWLSDVNPTILSSR